jgi:hypothetical protein
MIAGVFGGVLASRSGAGLRILLTYSLLAVTVRDGSRGFGVFRGVAGATIAATVGEAEALLLRYMRGFTKLNVTPNDYY